VVRTGQLISEGRINPQTSSAADLQDVSMPVKRRRQGTCYRRGRAGKKIITIPYRCWKSKFYIGDPRKISNFFILFLQLLVGSEDRF